MRFGLLARLARAKFPQGREGDIQLSLMLAREVAPAYPFDARWFTIGDIPALPIRPAMRLRIGHALTPAALPHRLTSAIPAPGRAARRAAAMMQGHHLTRLDAGRAAPRVIVC